jgi:hypothetical protein
VPRDSFRARGRSGFRRPTSTVISGCIKPTRGTSDRPGAHRFTGPHSRYTDAPSDAERSNLPTVLQEHQEHAAGIRSLAATMRNRRAQDPSAVYGCPLGSRGCQPDRSSQVLKIMQPVHGCPLRSREYQLEGARWVTRPTERAGSPRGAHGEAANWAHTVGAQGQRRIREGATGKQSQQQSCRRYLLTSRGRRRSDRFKRLVRRQCSVQRDSSPYRMGYGSGHRTLPDPAGRHQQWRRYQAHQRVLDQTMRRRLARIRPHRLNEDRIAAVFSRGNLEGSKLLDLAKGIQ